MIVYIARLFAVKKVQFMLSYAHSRQLSKDRTSCIFFGIARSSDEPGTKWVRSCYNRRRVVVLFWISVCSSLGLTAIWGSRKTQSKIHTEKYLILIIWSVSGIHNLLDILKGIAYNSTSFCDSIVSDLLKIYVHISGERPWNASWCIWTMQVITIRGNLLNVSSNFVPVEFRI
jgi:hypothetical protein